MDLIKFDEKDCNYYQEIIELSVKRVNGNTSGEFYKYNNGSLNNVIYVTDDEIVLNDFSEENTLRQVSAFIYKGHLAVITNGSYIANLSNYEFIRKNNDSTADYLAFCLDEGVVDYNSSIVVGINNEFGETRIVYPKSLHEGSFINISDRDFQYPAIILHKKGLKTSKYLLKKSENIKNMDDRIEFSKYGAVLKYYKNILGSPICMNVGKQIRLDDIKNIINSYGYSDERREEFISSTFEFINYYSPVFNEIIDYLNKNKKLVK